jgi:hypothetical protein
MTSSGVAVPGSAAPTHVGAALKAKARPTKLNIIFRILKLSRNLVANDPTDS